MSKIDPKVKNLFVFLVSQIGGFLFLVFMVARWLNITDGVYLLGLLVLSLIIWRACLSIYRRLVLPPKKPLEFGKWAIVTGTTSGIGKEFADYLAKEGMSLLIISRTESKLREQQEDIHAKYSIPVKYLAYDFTKSGYDERKDFYEKLDLQCKVMHQDGGIGLLINNVGTCNEHPKALDEFEDSEIEGLINCNVYSTVWMTRAVLKYMKERKNGCIVSISSGSGNSPSPFIQVYSATKAFMTQFSRSMKIECWGTGVDFYVVTPFYIVSNLYKKKAGTLHAPMPIKLVEGTMAQLGKKYVWQGNGYWVHGILDVVFTQYFWKGVDRRYERMIDNRQRYADKLKRLAAESSKMETKSEPLHQKSD